MSLALTSMDHNICEIKLYSDVNFRGNNIGLTKQGISREFGLKVVKSLEILGLCCWEIIKEKRIFYLKPGTRGNYHISMPFGLKKKNCPHSSSKLLNYLYSAGL